MKAKDQMKLLHSDPRFYVGDKNYQFSNVMTLQPIQQLFSKVSLILS